MSGIATAIIGGAIVGGVASSYGAKKAGESAEQAAQTSAGAQMEQLAYLKEREAVPQAYREQAIQQLGSLYGLPGQPSTGVPVDGAPVRQGPVRRGLAPTGLIGGLAGEEAGVPVDGYQPQSREAFLQGIQDDPLYAGMQEAGEEAILRGASATGGLRSGTANVNLARQNQALMRNIYSERVAGLQGMAGLPSGAAQIGQTMANIGQTQAQGIQAQGQAWQQGLQGVSGAVGTGVGNYLWAQGRGII